MNRGFSDIYLIIANKYKTFNHRNCIFIYFLKTIQYMLLGHHAQQSPTWPKASEPCPLVLNPPYVPQTSLKATSTFDVFV